MLEAVASDAGACLRPRESRGWLPWVGVAPRLRIRPVREAGRTPAQVMAGGSRCPTLACDSARRPLATPPGATDTGHRGGAMVPALSAAPASRRRRSRRVNIRRATNQAIGSAMTTLAAAAP